MSNPETALATTPQAGLTLLEGYQAYNAGSTPEAYQMDDDEQAELADVRVRPTRIKFDGVKGKYNRVGDEADPKGWDELQAALLAKLDDSQVLFPRKDAEGKQVFPEGGGQWPAYICRADSIHGQPVLHQDLTAEQIEIAKKLRVGGACGQTCSQCVHARWSGGEKPACSTSNNVLAFDGRLKEPVLLQVKGTSIKFLDRHLANYKKQKRSLYADVTQLASKEVVEDGKRWQVMTFARGEECGPEGADHFREMRRTLKPLLEHELRSGLSTLLDADAVAEEHPADVPVGDTLPPVATEWVDSPLDVPF
mgnify:CR=1 FL=1